MYTETEWWMLHIKGCVIFNTMTFSMIDLAIFWKESPEHVFCTVSIFNIFKTEEFTFTVFFFLQERERK